MNILHTSSTLYFYYEFYDIQNFKGKKKINLFDNSCVLCISLLDVKLPEDDPKKIETSRSISGLYVEVYF